MNLLNELCPTCKGAKVLTKLKIFKGEPQQYTKIPKLEVEQ